MIYIRKSQPKLKKGAGNRLYKVPQYRVVNTGKNGKKLNNSENVGSKPNCWKNILADLGNYEGAFGAWVKDETVKFPRRIFYHVTHLKKRAGK